MLTSAALPLYLNCVYSKELVVCSKQSNLCSSLFVASAAAFGNCVLVPCSFQCRQPLYSTCL